MFSNIFLLHGILKTNYLFIFSFFPFIFFDLFFFHSDSFLFIYLFIFVFHVLHLLLFLSILYFLLFLLPFFLSPCLISFLFNFVFLFLHSVASSFVLFRSILFSQPKFVSLQLPSSMSFAFNICTGHRMDGDGEDADSRFSYIFLVYLTPILVANYT
jgi:hypothetical protein